MREKVVHKLYQNGCTNIISQKYKSFSNHVCQQSSTLIRRALISGFSHYHRRQIERIPHGFQPKLQSLFIIKFTFFTTIDKCSFFRTGSNKFIGLKQYLKWVSKSYQQQN